MPSAGPQGVILPRLCFTVFLSLALSEFSFAKGLKTKCDTERDMSETDGARLELERDCDVRCLRKMSRRGNSTKKADVRHFAGARNKFSSTTLKATRMVGVTVISKIRKSDEPKRCKDLRAMVDKFIKKPIRELGADVGTISWLDFRDLHITSHDLVNERQKRSFEKVDGVSWGKGDGFGKDGVMARVSAVAKEVVREARKGPIFNKLITARITGVLSCGGRHIRLAVRADDPFHQGLIDFRKTMNTRLSEKVKGYTYKEEWKPLHLTLAYLPHPIRLEHVRAYYRILQKANQKFAEKPISFDIGDIHSYISMNNFTKVSYNPLKVGVIGLRHHEDE